MKLCLGTAQFGMRYGIANRTGQIDVTEAGRILERALAAGVTMLDTAVMYGESETTLGQAGAGRFAVVTKLPELPPHVGNITEWMKEHTNRSLRRLGVPSLYGLLLHRPMELLGPRGNEIAAGLMALKATGLTSKTGVSVYNPNELDQLSRFSFDIVQAPMSVFDRRLETTGWLQQLDNLGTEVHVRSVFLQGALLMSPDALPPHLGGLASPLRSFNIWCAGRDTKPLNAAVRFVLARREVGRVVIGVDSLVHLDEVLAAFTDEAMDVPPTFSIQDVTLIDPSRWAQ